MLLFSGSNASYEELPILERNFSLSHKHKYSNDAKEAINIEINGLSKNLYC